MEYSRKTASSNEAATPYFERVLWNTMLKVAVSPETMKIKVRTVVLSHRILCGLYMVLFSLSDKKGEKKLFS